MVKLIISGASFLLLFSFWIPILYNQVNTVKAHYWIPPLSIKDMLDFIIYFFSPLQLKGGEINFWFILKCAALAVLLVSIFLLIVYFIRNVKKYSKEKLFAGFFFISVFALTIIIPLIITFVVKPIIIPRYMLCVYGPLVLGIAILLKETYKNTPKSKYLILCTLISITLLSVFRLSTERKDFLQNNEELEQMKSFISKHSNGERPNVLTNPFRLRVSLNALLPEYNHLCYQEYFRPDLTPYQFTVFSETIPLPDKFVFIEDIHPGDKQRLEIVQKLTENTYLKTDSTTVGERKLLYFEKNSGLQ